MLIGEEASMIQETPRVEEFKIKLRETLRRETLRGRSVNYANRTEVYGVGDAEETIYFIQSGQVKLSMTSPAGKECILAIHTGGDIFGELCLSGIGTRSESAITMRSTVLKQLPCSHFFTCLARDGLLEGFVRYLAVRVADQQNVIANLVTVDSEQRLGQTLLQLARTMGKKDPHSIRIELRITHSELSEMVGTTRPRISFFMQRFHNLGLIETNQDRFFIIKENKLSDYLEHIAVV
jgi:CRP/FNR family cyclic AMP-dependent transcriptional regulator